MGIYLPSRDTPLYTTQAVVLPFPISYVPICVTVTEATQSLISSITLEELGALLRNDAVTLQGQTVSFILPRQGDGEAHALLSSLLRAEVTGFKESATTYPASVVANPRVSFADHVLQALDKIENSTGVLLGFASLLHVRGRNTTVKCLAIDGLAPRLTQAVSVGEVEQYDFVNGTLGRAVGSTGYPLLGPVIVYADTNRACRRGSMQIAERVLTNTLLNLTFGALWPTEAGGAMLPAIRTMTVYRDVMVKLCSRVTESDFNVTGGDVGKRVVYELNRASLNLDATVSTRDDGDVINVTATYVDSASSTHAITDVIDGKYLMAWSERSVTREELKSSFRLQQVPAALYVISLATVADGYGVLNLPVCLLRTIFFGDEALYWDDVRVQAHNAVPLPHKPILAVVRAEELSTTERFLSSLANAEELYGCVAEPPIAVSTTFPATNITTGANVRVIAGGASRVKQFMSEHHFTVSYFEQAELRGLGPLETMLSCVSINGRTACSPQEHVNLGTRLLANISTTRSVQQVVFPANNDANYYPLVGAAYFVFDRTALHEAAEQGTEVDASICSGYKRSLIFAIWALGYGDRIFQRNLLFPILSSHNQTLHELRIDVLKSVTCNGQRLFPVAAPAVVDDESLTNESRWIIGAAIGGGVPLLMALINCIGKLYFEKDDDDKEGAGGEVGNASFNGVMPTLASKMSFAPKWWSGGGDGDGGHDDAEMKEAPPQTPRI
eukprot:PhM_4_TR7602/c0_g1_i1/m.56334